MPETPLDDAGFATTSISRSFAIRTGSMGSAVIFRSLMNCSASAIAFSTEDSSKGIFDSPFRRALSASLFENAEDFVGQIPVFLRHAVIVPVELVGCCGAGDFVDAPEKIIRRNFQSIGQTAQVVKGRLPGSGLKVGYGRGLQAGAVSERFLAQLPDFFPRFPQT